MLRKKFGRLLLVGMMAMTTLVGCSSGEATPSTPSGEGATTEDKVKVTLLLTGSLGDKAFNDSAQAGMDKIKAEFGDQVETETIEIGFDKTKFEPAFIDVSESDSDIIVTGPWDMKEHIENNAPLYQDKKYIVFDTDVAYDEYDLNNVYSMSYKQNEAGFLAGALAALTTTSDMKFANPDKKIGFVGARDTSPVINDFLIGYIQGAQFIDPEMKVEVSYVGSFTDTAKAKELTLAQYAKGVDTVFVAAGPASTGTIEAALSAGKYVIGVDSDQALAYEGKEEANHIISSALKHLDTSIARGVELYLKDSLTFGAHEELGLKDQAVGLANNAIYETVVTEAIRTQVQEVEATLLNGEVELITALGMSQEDLQAIIKSAQ
ncbi:MAG: BMP family ABC transporter substrate-binding protein [Niameybacter sp.]